MSCLLHSLFQTAEQREKKMGKVMSRGGNLLMLSCDTHAGEVWLLPGADQVMMEMLPRAGLTFNQVPLLQHEKPGWLPEFPSPCCLL